jgi:hypothetical protein
MDEHTKKIMEVVETYANGNISDFKKWLKKCSKLEMLDAIEYYSGNVGGRHLIITSMRAFLSK